MNRHRLQVLVAIQSQTVKLFTPCGDENLLLPLGFHVPMKISPADDDAKIYLVVLTAAITPSVNVQLARNDPRQREQDYVRAFRFWLKNEDRRLTRLLFIENSGANLDIFRQIALQENLLGKEVEILSVPSRAVPPNMHYGWAELKMLDDGLRDSRLFVPCSHLIKVTGRLIFPNINKLLDKAPRDFDALVECRIPTRSYQKGLNFVQALINREGAYVSTQLFLAKKTFYEQHLENLADSIKPFTDSDMMEAVLYKRLTTLANSCSIRFRFPVNCDPSGIGASAGHIYESPSRKIVGKIRGLFRGIDLWI
jgi:hypothetical protein